MSNITRNPRLRNQIIKSNQTNTLPLTPYRRKHSNAHFFTHAIVVRNHSTATQKSNSGNPALSSQIIFCSLLQEVVNIFFCVFATTPSAFFVLERTFKQLALESNSFKVDLNQKQLCKNLLRLLRNQIKFSYLELFPSHSLASFLFQPSFQPFFGFSGFALSLLLQLFLFFFSSSFSFIFAASSA